MAAVARVDLCLCTVARFAPAVIALAAIILGAIIIRHRRPP